MFRILPLICLLNLLGCAETIDNPSLQCGEGTFDIDGQCVPEITTSCGPNTQEVDGQCLPNYKDICADGTQPIHGQCQALPTTPCEIGQNLIVKNNDAGQPNRLYVKITIDGQTKGLLVDTGSQVSFISTPPGSPDFQPNMASAQLGCKTLSLGGRPKPVWSGERMVDGIEIIGYLGNDYFLKQPTQLDLLTKTLQRVDPTLPLPHWVALPYENFFDFLFVTVQVDGQSHRLALDTGAPYTLLVPAMGKMNDQTLQTQDAFGNPVTLYLGQATLSLPDQRTRQIALTRTPSFPSLEQSNQQILDSLGDQIDGTIDGLIGISSIGRSTMRFDPQRQTIWLTAGPWDTLY